MSSNGVTYLPRAGYTCAKRPRDGIPHAGVVRRRVKRRTSVSRTSSPEAQPPQSNEGHARQWLTPWHGVRWRAALQGSRAIVPHRPQRGQSTYDARKSERFRAQETGSRSLETS
eukprot:scaffold5442_cov34-Tisochrysis_lutea.AAC.3